MKPSARFRSFFRNFEGAPLSRVEALPDPQSVAATPSRIPLIRPRLLVRTGDRVAIGSPLFEDKIDPGIRFLSPGGGTVAAIRYGERRVIREIVIDRDPEEPAAAFAPIDDATLSRMGRDQLIEVLSKRGLWPLIRELSFRGIAPRGDRPAMIWVPLDRSDPFHPAPDIYLHGAAERFAFGIRVLRKLAEPVHIMENTDRPTADPALRKLVTHRVSGPYPMNDPGVIHYRSKRSVAENRAWFIQGQDLLLIAEGLLAGTYPTTRIVAVSIIGNPAGGCHIKTRIGVPLDALVRAAPETDASRWVAGGLFGGQTVFPDGFLGLHDTALTLLPEAKAGELLGFIRPGWDKPSLSRTFLSALRVRPPVPDAGMHGEVRACVNCGSCMRVCPVDILPQFTYKCIHADAIDEALAHGLLDCIECGLCSYVCPSKIELVGYFRNARHAYRKELADR